MVRFMQDGSEETFPVTGCTEEDYQGIADVIFVCVKGYSLDGVLPFIDRISGPDSVIIPVLNIFTTGETLRSALPGKYAVDGCIYVSANIDEPGVLLQHSKILRVIYGAGAGQEKRNLDRYGLRHRLAFRWSGCSTGGSCLQGRLSARSLCARRCRIACAESSGLRKSFFQEGIAKSISCRESGNSPYNRTLHKQDTATG